MAVDTARVEKVASAGFSQYDDVLWRKQFARRRRRIDGALLVDDDQPLGSLELITYPELGYFRGSPWCKSHVSRLFSHGPSEKIREIITNTGIYIGFAAEKNSAATMKIAAGRSASLVSQSRHCERVYRLLAQNSLLVVVPALLVHGFGVRRLGHRNAHRLGFRVENSKRFGVRPGDRLECRFVPWTVLSGPWWAPGYCVKQRKRTPTGLRRHSWADNNALS